MRQQLKPKIFSNGKSQEDVVKEAVNEIFNIVLICLALLSTNLQAVTEISTDRQQSYNYVDFNIVNVIESNYFEEIIIDFNFAPILNNYKSTTLTVFNNFKNSGALIFDQVI